MEPSSEHIFVAQKALIIREDGKMLTMRRSATAPHRPLQWDLPGGRLEVGEDARDGILREIKEETGLEVSDLKVIDAISAFAENKEFWLTICYSARLVNDNVILSFEHDQFQWVTADELTNLLGSRRNKQFVERFISQL